ncbi:hypothetical protein [uncultured Chitinophaga sp.]|uniref:hypothetical protein n=1 Tax=uncultured Chitinophaga sp. TaxID=339340 RepID=UPI002633270E|nr:hypothetical protein [uncultured Chitinophaga sp.]
MILKEAVGFFKQHAAEALVLGCTELSLLGRGDFCDGMLLFDSTEILARALIREATC